MSEQNNFKFTDEEWREYQNLPDQGYSHRGHLEHVVNRWLSEELRKAKYDAWEEGYANGDADASTECRLDSVNPYSNHEQPHVHTRRSSFGDLYCKTCGEDLSEG